MNKLKIQEFPLRPADAIFTYQNSWLNKWIFWFSKWRVPKKYRKDKIAHVAIYIGAANGKRMLAEADWNGIKIRDIKIYDKKKYILHIGRPQNIGLNSANKQLLIQYVKDKKDEPYAYAQLVGIACKKILGLNKIGDWDRDSMICSEFYANVLRECFNKDIFPGKKSYDLSPLDIYNSKNIKILV